MPLTSLSVDRLLADRPLALTRAGLEQLRAEMLARLALAPEQLAAIGNQRGPVSAVRANATAVVPIRGAIQHHAGSDLWSLLFGGASIDAMRSALRELANDDQVGAIVLDIDSPGGVVEGVPELAAEIRELRERKPIVALANAMAASAAYWLAAQATEVYATPSALVGSVGVYLLHMDYSRMLDADGITPTYIAAGRYKTEGNSAEPLSDEAAAHLQSLVDETYDQFVADVAAGRGVSVASVRGGYGEGRVLSASAAEAAGMVDRIATLDDAIARATTLAGGAAPSAANGQAAGAFRLWRMRHNNALAGISTGGDS